MTKLPYIFQDNNFSSNVNNVIVLLWLAKFSILKLFVKFLRKLFGGDLANGSQQNSFTNSQDVILDDWNRSYFHFI